MALHPEVVEEVRPLVAEDLGESVELLEGEPLAAKPDELVGRRATG
jgi:hypothetical protein